MLVISFRVIFLSTQDVANVMKSAFYFRFAILMPYYGA